MTPYLLHHLVERSARRYPRRPALRLAPAGEAPEVWSYTELERASRVSALQLRHAGLPPGGRVGVWMRKSPAAVAALLAALRAGGVYVPFDPGAPPARIAALAADCGLWGLFADPDLAAAAAAGWAQPPQLLPPPARAAGGLAPLPPAPRTSDQLAYILYTSGSTGVPKGVMLSHAHALNFIAWAADTTALAPGDRVASYAPFHFDLSVFDLWATLGRGAEVCLLDRVTARFPRAVAEWMAAQAITVWYAVPSALVQVLPHREALGPGPRCVIFAGEVFPAPALRAWRLALPRADFHNWYGPTETNVCVAYRLPPVPRPLPEPLPIGRACPNFELALLDARRRPVAPGLRGTLWVRGPGILSGYWGDAARTARVRRHLPGAAAGSRWYNTGDRVRRRPDGELYFEGRRDDLVKCRGYRISLLEVATALEACPGVRQAAVIAVAPPDFAISTAPGAAAGPTALAAFVSGAADLEAAGLRRQLAERLPGYMVPERIEVWASLPVTASGKVDRQRLRPTAARPAARLASGEAAASASSR